ncbi:MAG: DUF1833 family protein [Acidimicrobiia bacterium]|nr:DUF1833 family protein [Acidimicrobiia bacterium]
MARNVSLPAIQASLAQQTDEVYLVLLEISHPDLMNPIRVVNNNEDVTSNMNVYTAFPFMIQLPDDQEGREPRAELRIDNVSRMLIDEIRSLSTPPTITISVILASSPNVIEWGPLEFLTQGANYDAQQITFGLVYTIFAEEPFPFRQFDTINFPGMFK